MNDEIMETISHGDINLLKQLPKTILTYNTSKLLMNNLKNNLQDVKNQMINAECVDTEFKYIICNFSYKLKNIEECIKYLEKIK